MLLKVLKSSPSCLFRHFMLLLFLKRKVEVLAKLLVEAIFGRHFIYLRSKTMFVVYSFFLVFYFLNIFYST